MRPYKKFFSVVLAMAMVMTMSVTAYATGVGGASSEQVPTPTPIGRITVINPGTETYRAYKIFDAVFKEQTGAPDYEQGTVTYMIDAESGWLNVVYDIATSTSHISGLTFTFNQENNKYTVTKDQNFSAESFAKYLRNNIPTGAQAQAIPFSGATAGFLEDGYYLVIASEESGENQVDQERAMLVTVLDGREVKIENKNDMPFDKTVNGKKVTDVQIGEVITFNIETRIPYDDVYELAAGNNTAYSYKISDTMDPSLAIEKNTFKVTIGEGRSAAELTVGGPVPALIEVTTPNDELSSNQVRFGQNDKTFELSLDIIDLIRNSGFARGSKITISYDATVTSGVNARIAVNHTDLKYGKTGPDHTIDSEAKVYDSQIIIDKIARNNDSKKLKGAEFVLYRVINEADTETENDTNTDAEPVTNPDTGQDQNSEEEPQQNIEFYKEIYKKYSPDEIVNLTEDTDYQKVTVVSGEDSHEIYYALDGDGQWIITAIEFVRDIDQATVKTTDGNGHAEFIGLKDGTYYLKETKAPQNYTKLKDPLEIVVSGADCITPGLTNDEITAKLTETAKVKNTIEGMLPSTGGTGTILFYMAGLLLAVTGFVALVIRRRISL